MHEKIFIVVKVKTDIKKIAHFLAKSYDVTKICHSYMLNIVVWRFFCGKFINKIIYMKFYLCFFDCRTPPMSAHS